MTKDQRKKHKGGKAKQRKRKNLKQLSPSYRKRIQRGLAKGLTRSQSRGHPKHTEKYIAEKKRKVLTGKQKKRFFIAIRDHKSFKDAARTAGISQEKLRRFITSSPYIVKKDGVWVFDDNMPTAILIYSRGKEHKITVTYKVSKEIGAYLYAVSQFLETREKSYLEPYIGKSVIDIKTGKIYPYETNGNNLLIIDQTSDTAIENIYNPDTEKNERVS